MIDYKLFNNKINSYEKEKQFFVEEESESIFDSLLNAAKKSGSISSIIVTSTQEAKPVAIKPELVKPVFVLIDVNAKPEAIKPEELKAETPPEASNELTEEDKAAFHSLSVMKSVLKKCKVIS